MRRNLFWSLYLIFISACGPSPEVIATQTATAATAIAAAWTATPITTPTMTPSPTATFTPSPTVTPSPTFTPTPTIAPTPTETPKPKFEFFSGFERGFAGFDEYIARQGATLEIIDDPTGSGRGKVLKGTISGKAVDQGGYLAHRAHPGNSLSPQSFPCRVQEDIWMSRQFFNDIKGENWYSQLSLFEKVGRNGRVFVTTSMIEESSWTGYGLGITGYMTLNIQDPDRGIQSFQKILPGAPKFTPEEWHTMAVDVDASGRAYLYQDNQLITTGELIQYPQRVLGNAHGGPIYGGPSFSEGGYVLVDNYRVICWP